VLVNKAKGHSLASIQAFIKNIQAAGEQLRQNANPRLVLEILMLNLPEAVRKSEKSPAA